MCLILTNCASEAVKPRPGVLEAQSCMRHLNTAPADFPDYIIRSCTNTGVWIVEKTDIQTGAMMSRYDFVNRDYEGPDTGGAPISIEALGGSQERDFVSLQKKLNKALLN